MRSITTSTTNHSPSARGSRRPSRWTAGAVAAIAAGAMVLASCGTNGDVSARAPDGADSSSSTTAPAPTATNAPAPASPPAADASYTSAITSQPVDNPAFDSLQRDITRRVNAAGLPGASLLVLKDGKLVEQEAFGSYNLDTVVPIASASKWMAGATIMTLVQDGLIDLDKPISTYLPDAQGQVGTITTRQLLAFTSGLEYDERIPCYSDGSKTLAECNKEILALPLLGPPGTGYRYTGTHLHVAAGVAEAVTGKTFEELFQERIARPLGMTNTTFIGRIIPATAPDGHPAPAGSARSSLGDYGRFLEMLVHGGVAPSGERILTEASLAEMSKVQTGDAKFVSAASYRKKDQTPYGLAHWIDVVNPDGTARLESSPGAFGFRPWIDHDNDIAGVYLIQDMTDDHVIDSPDRQPNGEPTVHTSGGFVVTDSAAALGVRAPA